MIALTGEQLSAVAAIEEAIGRGTRFALHGLAGTGKTTVAAHLARSQRGARLCAYTGKAASALRTKTGLGPRRTVPPHTRARGATAASVPPKRVLAAASAARHIPEPMTGSPLKRQRKLGVVRAEDGSVIAFPRLTHPRAGLSHAEWRGLGPAEKIERLFGVSLDDLFEIMSWPIGELDPFRLSVRMQVTRVVFAICLKPMLDGKLGRDAARERDRQRMLAELARNLRQADSRP
jgi:hypothetical protein